VRCRLFANLSDVNDLLRLTVRRVGRVSEALLGLTLPARKTSSSRPPVAAPAVRSGTHVSAFALVVY